MWIERTNDKSYPYMVNDSWGGKAYITSLEDLKREIRKIEKENKKKVLTNSQLDAIIIIENEREVNKL